MNKYFKLLTLSVFLSQASILFSADSVPVEPDKGQAEALPFCWAFKSLSTWPIRLEVRELADIAWEKEKARMVPVREEFKTLSKEGQGAITLNAFNKMVSAASGYPQCIKDAAWMEKKVNREVGVENAHGCIDSYMKNSASFQYLQEPNWFSEKIVKNYMKFAAAKTFSDVSKNERKS